MDSTDFRDGSFRLLLVGVIHDQAHFPSVMVGMQKDNVPLLYGDVLEDLSPANVRIVMKWKKTSFLAFIKNSNILYLWLL